MNQTFTATTPHTCCWHDSGFSTITAAGGAYQQPQVCCWCGAKQHPWRGGQAATMHGPHAPQQSVTFTGGTAAANPGAVAAIGPSEEAREAYFSRSCAECD